MLRSYMKMRFHNNLRDARFILWVTGYWVAFNVNAAFDVYLEGPQGGIWFWSMFGVGLFFMMQDKMYGRSTIMQDIITVKR